MGRQAIIDALAARLSGSLAGQVNTFGTRLRHFADVEPSAQPAVFLKQEREAVLEQPNGRPMRRVNVTAFVYAYDASPTGPGPRLNDLTDAIEAALAGTPADNGEHTSLGGLVSHARVVGTTDDDGTLGDQGVVAVDIELLIQG